MLSRRGLLFGLGAVLVTAPAIVHASNLMPIKSFIELPRTRKIVLDFDEATRTVFYKHRDTGSIVSSWINPELEAYGDKTGRRIIEPNYHEVIEQHWKTRTEAEMPRFVFAAPIDLDVVLPDRHTSKCYWAVNEGRVLKVGEANGS